MSSFHRFVLVFAFACVAGPCLAGSDRPDVVAASSRTEADAIIANILAIHPEGPRLATNPRFREQAERLRAVADGADLADYVIALNRLFFTVQDGHTAVLSLFHDAKPFSLRFPILVQPFADGMYVIEAKDEGLPLLGGKLIAVNGHPVDRVLTAYVAQAPSGNTAFAMRWSPFLFAFPGWLHGLGFAEGDIDAPIEYVVALPGGRIERALLQPRAGAHLGRSPVARAKHPVEAMPARTGGPNFVEPFPKMRAVYVSLDEMADTEGKTFAVFADEVAAAIRNPVFDRLVIDLRRNGGGNNLLPEALRREIQRSRLNRPGGIYLLIGPQTFSAAMNFASRLERETEAIFVGEPTRGRPNHFGDAKLFTTSGTKIQYLVSTLRWQDSSPLDDRMWILPDLPVVATFADHLAARDPVRELALRHRPTDAEAAAPLRAERWRRQSQGRGWRFFFETGVDVTGPVEAPSSVEAQPIPD